MKEKLPMPEYLTRCKLEQRISELESEVDKRKYTEVKLLRERDNLKNIFEAMDDGVYIINNQYDLQFVNQTLIKDFGVYNGRKCYRYFHDRDNFCPLCKNHKVFEGATVHSESYSPKTHKFYDVIETPIRNSDGSISKLKMFHDITERKQSEDEIKKLLAKKNILLKEVHHRIKNNMQIIKELLAIQSDMIKIPGIAPIFQDAIARIESMGVLYDKLYRTESYENVSIKEYLSQLIDEIVQIFPYRQNINIEKQIDDFSIGAKNIFSIGIIISEILTNAMKYAFIDRDNGLLKISAKKEYNHVIIVFEDNGVGISELKSSKKTKGFGMKLIKMLVDQIDGSYKIVNSNGTKYIIEFEI